MTVRHRAWSAGVFVALAVAAPVWLFTTAAQAQTIWCGLAWPCDTAGPPPAAAAAGKYTAIAASNHAPSLGVATGQSSADAAGKLALAQCSANGTVTDCTVAQAANAGCLGLANSPPGGTYGATAGPNLTRADAWTHALKDCRDSGGANCRVMATACAIDEANLSPRFPLPPDVTGGAAVDPATIGIWEIPMNPGRWVWEIAATGAYEFHTEAPDGAPSHAGIFTASGGKWTLQSTAGFVDSDGGFYQMQGPDLMVMSGALGLGAWHRIK